MDFAGLQIILALGTLLAVIVFALRSKMKTEELMEDDDAPKSTLAADGPDTR
ncbi:MAG: hypothetical protein AAGG54_11075 [Pseudomonadota bacterium]